MPLTRLAYKPLAPLGLKRLCDPLRIRRSAPGPNLDWPRLCLLLIHRGIGAIQQLLHAFRRNEFRQTDGSLDGQLARTGALVHRIVSADPLADALNLGLRRSNLAIEQDQELVAAPAAYKVSGPAGRFEFPGKLFQNIVPGQMPILVIHAL